MERSAAVDSGEKFESSFPAIAAGEGGRLVVVWVNHYSSTTDGLFSATLDPGSAGFQPPCRSISTLARPPAPIRR